ncbi:hypothetical protein QPK87_05995 [Kamptonema cortianum]|nr:hypothetical protein [Geitlerinema splendidum]MDK3156125.1 hypothetical protein [Kamptonema cortianum]
MSPPPTSWQFKCCGESGQQCFEVDERDQWCVRSDGSGFWGKAYMKDYFPVPSTCMSTHCLY